MFILSCLYRGGVCGGRGMSEMRRVDESAIPRRALLHRSAPFLTILTIILGIHPSLSWPITAASLPRRRTSLRGHLAAHRAARQPPSSKRTTRNTSHRKTVSWEEVSSSTLIPKAPLPHRMATNNRLRRHVSLLR